MTEKKNGTPMEKLERDFRVFQKAFEKFVTNDFAHLAADVSTITSRLSAFIEQNGKQYDEIKQGVEVMLKNEGEMKQTMVTGLEVSTRIIESLNRER